MLFNSYAFLVFFPLVALVLFLLPRRFQWAWLLGSSIFFYSCWSVPFLSLIAVVVGTTFGAAILMEGATIRRKRALLTGALVICLGQLFVFKYFDFAVGPLARLIDGGWAGLKLVLPVGISFYTFHAMSYVVDVYRGRYPVERHLGYYSLFVLYFPLLLAGPIERPGNLLPQLKERALFRPSNATVGLRYILWGFFKKVAIADVLSPYVSRVYAAPHEFTGPALATATLLFAFQIYCDFSGYSDIAVGCAKIMGVDLTKNFERPYFAASVSDFWRRWHVSLSTWFRDYVYVPLGGNRVTPVRQAWAILVTFLLSGIWHGANWTFVVWGALHGIAVALPRLLSRGSRFAVPRLVGWLVTFVFVCLAWVFFRAQDLGVASDIYSRLLGGWSQPTSALKVPAPFPTTGVLGILALLIVQRVGQTDSLEGLALKVPRGVRWCVYYCLVFWTVWFGAYGGDAFIYFQF